MSPALGIGFDKGGILGHADIGLSYLHNNRFGFTGGVFANGRDGISASELKHPVKSYSGGTLQAIINVFPYEETQSKLLFRAGLCYGTGYYYQWNEGVSGPTSGYYTSKYYQTIAGELSLEFLFNHKPNRAWGFQFYGMLQRHAFVGITLRYAFGVFN